MTQSTNGYAVRIGSGYYASDDQPAVADVADALTQPTRGAADADAEHVRATWDVEPADVEVVPVSR